MRRIIFFFRFFVWFSLRNLRKHPARALTVLVGISLGAAVFTSVRLSVNASLESFTRTMDLFAGTAEQVVVRPGGYVPERLIADLLRHPSVTDASPILSTYVSVEKGDNHSFLLIGLDPILDRNFRHWYPTESSGEDAPAWLQLLNEPMALILTQPLANQLAVDRGDPLTLAHSRRMAEFTVRGVLSRDGLALAEGGRLALTDIASFQEFTGLFGQVDRIDLKFKPDITGLELEKIRKTLTGSNVFRTPTAMRESGQGMIRAYQLNLSVLSFASLFVGMFLVYSLVSLNAAARRRELAILRSTGGSAQLLFLIFLAEGALFGIAGWLLAIPISSFLVRYMLQGVSQTISTLFVRVHVENISYDFWELGLSFGITLMIALIAALQPAREAMTVAPKEALEISYQGQQFKKSPKQIALTGLICLVMVLPLSFLPGISGLPLPGYVAILSLFIGFALLAPWLLEQLGHRISPRLGWAASVPSYLAARYVRDSGIRTAVAVGALITAVALYTSLVIMIFSFRQTVELWVHQSISGDLFLTTKMGDINQFRYTIDSETVTKLQQISDDVDLVPSRRFQLTYKNFPYEFEVMGMAAFMQHGSFVWLKGESEERRALVRKGAGVLISEVFSNRTGLTVGDRYKAQIDTSMVDLPVLGVIRDYRTRGGIVFYDWHEFNRRYHSTGWSGVRFYFRDQSRLSDTEVTKLRNLIIDCCGEKLDIISGKQLRQAVLRIFDETFAVTTVLLFIALVIAALGIATTLTVQVLQRSRQLNTLIAVGAGFNQIRSMVFWEAVFMVIVGEFVGLACGAVLSYLLVYVINKQSFGWTFIYSVDWPALGLSLPLIILTALAAALPAIKAAFRAPPATLLKER